MGYRGVVFEEGLLSCSVKDGLISIYRSAIVDPAVSVLYRPVRDLLASVCRNTQVTRWVDDPEMAFGRAELSLLDSWSECPGTGTPHTCAKGGVEHDEYRSAVAV